jgi:hypothetical protein
MGQSGTGGQLVGPFVLTELATTRSCPQAARMFVESVACRYEHWTFVHQVTFPRIIHQRERLAGMSSFTYLETPCRGGGGYTGLPAT